MISEITSYARQGHTLQQGLKRIPFTKEEGVDSIPTNCEKILLLD